MQYDAVADIFSKMKACAPALGLVALSIKYSEKYCKISFAEMQVKVSVSVENSLRHSNFQKASRKRLHKNNSCKFFNWTNVCASFFFDYIICPYILASLLVF